MKNCYLLFAILLSQKNFVYAQRTVVPSDKIIIEGEIKTPLKFTLENLDTFATVNINDLAITNQ